MPDCLHCGKPLKNSSACSYCGRAQVAPEDDPTRNFSDVADSATSHLPTFAPDERVGDRFRIVRFIARGGMGELYTAHDTHRDDTVVVKVLPRSKQGDVASRDRLRSEVDIAKKLRHPNVCQVFEATIVEDRLIVAMEFIRGCDMATMLRLEGPPPLEQAIDIATQFCRGLAAIHDHGVLHLDLKPANVMVADDGRVVITDFGLASVAAEFSGEPHRAGTPAYMAPERHARAKVTVRTDMYCLGLVLYELFTGRRAFSAGDAKTYAKMHRDQLPVDPLEINTDLPGSVGSLILACLAKGPSQRPKSAVAVLNMLAFDA